MLAAHVPGSAFLTGLAVGATLIVAIGAQNAFVLRQGLRREHVPHVVIFCVGADVVLLTIGVAGVGQMLNKAPALSTVLLLAGALFLFAYGVRSLRQALRVRALDVQTDHAEKSLRTALLQLAAFTFLNPHVYLDTVLLLGSIGARQPDGHQVWFVSGALMASVGWFSALGFGARLLTPLFATPRAWRVLDLMVGVMMIVLAVTLVTRGVQMP